MQPTPYPTKAPTTPSPTATADPIVRIQSINAKRYLWVGPDGGFKASTDAAPLANTEITLKRHECVKEQGFYHFDENLASPCYLFLWEQSAGQRMYAQSGKSWRKGVSTTKENTIWNDNIWFLEAIPCGDGDYEEGTCTLLRNAKNGRSMYDNINKGVLGASPEGDPTWIWTNSDYRWHLIDVATGTALDVTNLD